ncbi:MULTISPECIES: ATP-binding protein [Streptomyces]|uniref:ATP-binding protein n=1 Tax=Streptomyces mutomycini TaxID=284036 RepID=A0ABW0AWZ8_9ACTN|nr:MULTISPECIES: ATP-binding protein [Streptomyces]
MHPYSPSPQRTALCPARAPLSAPGATPRLRPKPRPHAGLVLSLTLPGDPRSAAVGRHAVTAALSTYGLRSHTWPVALAVTELIAVNAALTPGRELYLSLRHRDGGLRLVLWDQHPRHADPDTLALCEVRRRRALWLLAVVVDDWGGDWGTCEAQPPHQGTKSWAVLPQ